MGKKGIISMLINYYKLSKTASLFDDSGTLAAPAAPPMAPPKPKTPKPFSPPRPGKTPTEQPDQNPVKFPFPVPSPRPQNKKHNDASLVDDIGDFRMSDLTAVPEQKPQMSQQHKPFFV